MKEVIKKEKDVFLKKYKKTILFFVYEFIFLIFIDFYLFCKGYLFQNRVFQTDFQIFHTCNV